VSACGGDVTGVGASGGCTTDWRLPGFGQSLPVWVCRTAMATGHFFAAPVHPKRCRTARPGWLLRCGLVVAMRVASALAVSPGLSALGSSCVWPCNKAAPRSSTSHPILAWGHNWRRLFNKGNVCMISPWALSRTIKMCIAPLTITQKHANPVKPV
jgi:hypothetical protein